MRNLENAVFMQVSGVSQIYGGASQKRHISKKPLKRSIYAGLSTGTFVTDLFHFYRGDQKEK